MLLSLYFWPLECCFAVWSSGWSTAERSIVNYASTDLLSRQVSTCGTHGSWLDLWLFFSPPHVRVFNNKCAWKHSKSLAVPFQFTPRTCPHACPFRTFVLACWPVWEQPSATGSITRWWPSHGSGWFLSRRVSTKVDAQGRSQGFALLNQIKMTSVTIFKSH